MIYYFQFNPNTTEHYYRCKICGKNFSTYPYNASLHNTNCNDFQESSLDNLVLVYGPNHKDYYEKLVQKLRENQEAVIIINNVKGINRKTNYFL